MGRQPNTINCRLWEKVSSTEVGQKHLVIGLTIMQVAGLRRCQAEFGQTLLGGMTVPPKLPRKQPDVGSPSPERRPNLSV